MTPEPENPSTHPETANAPSSEGGGQGGGRTRYVIGCMSGTSLDGLDCVLTKITGTGLQMEAGFVRLRSAPFPRAISVALNALVTGRSVNAQVITTAARAMGKLHADTIEQLLQDEPNTPIDFVCAHGQTIYHNGDAHLSFQLFDPWPVVHRLQLPVCFDLRQADLVAGGQGAPLSPIADPILYHGQPQAAIVNLGGICNITHWTTTPGKAPAPGSDDLEALRGDENESNRVRIDPIDIHGFDAGPCNLLLDGLSQCLLNMAYDQDGHIAASTEPDLRIVDKIRQRIAGALACRSMGREQFGKPWLNSLLVTNDMLSPQAWISSANQAVAEEIAEAVTRVTTKTAVFAGGGVKNQTLMARIKQACQGITVVESEALGIPACAREAMAWAILGALSQDGVPISLPQVTTPGSLGIDADDELSENQAFKDDNLDTPEKHSACVAGSWAGIYTKKD